MEITHTSWDYATGYRTGRCGEWYIRVRHDGVTFDLAKPPFQNWEKANQEFVGLSIDQASRLLGLPRGDLFAWGRAP